VLHYFFKHQHIAQGIIIAVGDIVAFIQKAAPDKHRIGAIRKGSENMLQVDPAGAHDTDKPHICRILQSGNSSHVSSAVRSPMTNETQHFWLECKICAHSSFTPFSLFLVAPVTRWPVSPKKVKQAIFPISTGSTGSTG
jgi:hypothetical protein